MLPKLYQSPSIASVTVVLSTLNRRLLLILGVPTVCVALMALGFQVNSNRKAPPTLPVVFQVTPSTKMIVEKVQITEDDGYTMLRVRGRWLGDNLAQMYRVRLGIADFEHAETTSGLTWYVPVPSDGQSGHRFSLDVKNPPHASLPETIRDALPLPVQLRFKYREGSYAPPLASLRFVLNPQNIEYVPRAARQIAAR